MVDVTVRGAGIFGLSIAWACARRGARVRVVDPHGVGAGSSGGLVGAMSPHVPEAWNAKKAFQLDSLLMAGDWWAGVQAASGLPSGYGRHGRLQPLADEAAVTMARRRGETATILWRGLADWRVVPATGAAWEPVSPLGWLVEDTLSAHISPRLALGSLVQALREQGSEVQAEATDGTGAVVHATGLAGLADLSASLGKTVGSGVKGQALALRHSAPDAPQLFVDGLHIVPHLDGTVAVGSTSEATWDSDDPDDRLQPLADRARSAVPALRDAEVVGRWAGIRPRAISRAPVLGSWPGRPGHFVANGGFKIGFGMAPKIAEVMADLVLEGRDSIPVDFRIEALL
jgi:glycine oxidase